MVYKYPKIVKMVVSTDIRGVTMEQSKEMDVGIITPKGIWYEGLIFSCSLAIKERWYQISEQIGGWPVAVRYSAEKPNELYIRLEDGSSILDRCKVFGIDKVKHYQSDSPWDWAQRLINKIT